MSNRVLQALSLIPIVLLSTCTTPHGETTDGRPEAKPPGTTPLPDGVYPAYIAGDPTPRCTTVVELLDVPIDGAASARGTVRVPPKPVLQFDAGSDFGFEFENGECVQVSFRNSDNLKAYTKRHAGQRMAIVIDNTVISHHMIREPLHAGRIQITCCTVGGGDHLHKHLTELAARSRSASGK